MTAAPAPLEAEGLAVMRGDHMVVKAVSLRVAAGQWLHLQGANGAGKTSLLEVLCGLRRAAAGRIAGQPPPERLHWLGHRNGLNGTLTPLENLRFWCRLHGVEIAEVPLALARVGLAGQQDMPVRALSTGQRRRAALARLLVQARGWWFLDEPLAGLDDGGSQLVAELLAEHLHAGGAAVVTSHQPLPSSARLPPARVLPL
jgi:heme exporter protein A